MDDNQIILRDDIDKIDFSDISTGERLPLAWPADGARPGSGATGAASQAEAALAPASVRFAARSRWKRGKEAAGDLNHRAGALQPRQVGTRQQRSHLGQHARVVGVQPRALRG